MFSLELPHRVDSNEYTQHTIINIKIHPTYPKTKISAAMGFFIGTQKKSRGKRAIGVSVTEALQHAEHSH